MINLFAILKKYHVQLLFVLLLGIGITLTIQQRQYQNVIFINSANAISGGAYSTVANIGDYFELQSINEKLANENARLRAMINPSLKKVNGDYFEVNDTLFKQRYIYRTANVVSNTYTLTHNYLTLDLGKEDGVIEEMGVISPEGIVGIVGAVSSNYCTVISFLHPKTTVSCKIQSNGVAGLLKWDNSNIHYAQIKDIPITTQIQEKDTILTSGYSSVFPSGIYLGTVESFERNLENQTQNVKVKLNIQFESISKVYIVENLFKEEQQQLKKKEDKLSE